MIVADAHEKERHAFLGRVVAYLLDGLVLGGDAVGEHDDRRQGGAAIVVDHLAQGGPQAAIMAFGFEVGDRLVGALQKPGIGVVRDVAGAAAGVRQLDGPSFAVQMVNVDLAAAPIQEVVEPILLRLGDQRPAVEPSWSRVGCQALEFTRASWFCQNCKRPASTSRSRA